MRLLGITCGPFRGAVSFCLRGVGFRVSGTYLVVGHIFFDDHFDMKEKGIFEGLV